MLIPVIDSFRVLGDAIVYRRYACVIFHYNNAHMHTFLANGELSVDGDDIAVIGVNTDNGVNIGVRDEGLTAPDPGVVEPIPPPPSTVVMVNVVLGTAAGDTVLVESDDVETLLGM